ncbi:MAG: hypothetical protein RL547_302 [Actinomycetota bacterium]
MLNRVLDESFPEETRRHVVAVTVARLTANGSFRFAPPFLASISDDLSTSLSRIGVALMITELLMIVSPAIGSAVDRMHRRTSMVAGLLGVTAAAAVAAASPGLVVFVIAIAVLGMSKLVFDVGLTAWVNDHVDYERRGRVIGITETSWALGLLLGVTIMGLVASASSWRWGYVTGAVATAIMALVLARRLGPDAPHQTERHDRSRVTRLPRRGYWVILAMFFLMAASQCMFVTFGSWLDDEFGFSEAGIAAVAFGLGAFELLASITSARRTDTWGKERSTMFGAALIVPSGLLLALGGSNVGIGLVFLALFLLGFEFGIVSLLPLAANMIPDSPARGLGFAIGGGTMGRAVMSLVATATYDRHGIDIPAVIGSACALCVIASLVAFERNEARSAVQPR